MTDSKILDPERRREFAREQLQFLKDQGIVDPARLSRIFKAAGPGQVKEAWALATSETEQTRIDLLDCILTGAFGSQQFGRDRMIKVLQLCKLYVPQTPNFGRFARILDGALEILVPGSFEFTAEELKEIEGHRKNKLEEEHIGNQ